MQFLFIDIDVRPFDIPELFQQYENPQIEWRFNDSKTSGYRQKELWSSGALSRYESPRRRFQTSRRPKQPVSIMSPKGAA